MPVRTPSEDAIESARLEIAEECASGPTQVELAEAPLLQDWSICQHPQVGGPVMSGRVYGHPTVVDGTRITTTHVALIDEDGLSWGRTLSRYYLLGRPEHVPLH
jgi:hypothetical protein